MTIVDGNGLIVLDRSVFLRLASSQHLGRLSVTRQALPIVLPVAFGLVDESPVFKVGRGAVRDAAANDAVCCFEVDAADPSWSWAWSVMVIGRITLISDPVMVLRAGELGLPAWRPDGDVRFVRIEPEIVSGCWHSGFTDHPPPPAVRRRRRYETERFVQFSHAALRVWWRGRACPTRRRGRETACQLSRR